MKNKKRILSLFSCCGGMDIGFEGGFSIVKNTLNIHVHDQWIEKEDQQYFYLKETIFETVFANDINAEAKKTWCDYFSKKRGYDVSARYTVGSIVDIVKEYKAGNIGVLPQNIDVVTGGFPCQDFSIAGKRKGFDSHIDHNGETIGGQSVPTEETRGKLYMWMKEVIEITLPKIFIAENVKGLTNLGEVKKTIQSDFAQTGGDGYIVIDPQVLHAGRYGVPQSRERIFFIGFKKSALTAEALKELSKNIISDTFSPYPKPTHQLSSEKNLFNQGQNMVKYVRCGSVLSDLKEPDETKDPSQEFYSKAKYMGTHCQGQKEVDLCKLAPTIRAEHHGNIEFRRLSLENGGKHNDEISNGLIER